MVVLINRMMKVISGYSLMSNSLVQFKQIFIEQFLEFVLLLFHGHITRTKTSLWEELHLMCNVNQEILFYVNQKNPFKVWMVPNVYKSLVQCRLFCRLWKIFAAAESFQKYPAPGTWLNCWVAFSTRDV